MGWTKRQFISQAFETIGLASYVFDLQPEQLQSALRQLDAQLSAWNAAGIRIGYPLPASPQDSDLDEQTGVPDSANEAIYYNLATRLAVTYGKGMSPDSKAIAKIAYNTLLSRSAMPQEMQLPGNLPAGEGGVTTFIDAPEIRISAGPDSPIEFA